MPGTWQHSNILANCFKAPFRILTCRAADVAQQESQQHRSAGAREEGCSAHEVSPCACFLWRLLCLQCTLILKAFTSTLEETWRQQPYLKEVGQSMGEREHSEWLPLSTPIAASVVPSAWMLAQLKGHHSL